MRKRGIEKEFGDVRFRSCPTREICFWKEERECLVPCENTGGEKKGLKVKEKKHDGF